MAKLSSINKNERRKKLVKKYAGRYARLKAVANDESADDGERLIARLGPRASLEEVLLALVSCRWPKAWHVRGPSQYVPWCRARFADLGSRRPPDRDVPAP